ncbi:MAG: hypothetical protein OXM56_14545 [Gammaproteobacteria bacterium]|nr:hypothetical protein [Boseongicola sp.]MDE0350908.1 hypothetical protein [Gammaproteobacteria bacterium]
MFERLFTCGFTIEWCLTGPLLDERLRWLEHCIVPRLASPS